MAKSPGAMHVATIRNKRVNKVGDSVEYVSHLVRRNYREGKKVKHQTIANLSNLPGEAIEAVRAVLAGEDTVTAGQRSVAGMEITGSLPHGHVAAVMAQAKQLGLPALLGRASRRRDIAFALIIARVIQPGSKLATTRWWTDTTLRDLGVGDASTDEVYAAMDWLQAQQTKIEKKLADKHLSAEVNPDRLALFDLSSSWVTGSHCPLAARGYSRDGKKGLEQIEYGLLTDPQGRPVSVRVHPGNTADPAAFEDLAADFKSRYQLEDIALVGDRGMITNARINQLKDLGGIDWVTALRAPAIKKLAADQGPLQMSLFDQTNLAEISHPDYPGERLIACRNPYLAEDRARKRDALLDATEAELGKVKAAAEAGRTTGAGRIGVRVGKVINKYKMAKHFHTTIEDSSFSYTRNEEAIAEEAALDGIYIIRTSLTSQAMSGEKVVATYKSLAHVERDFRSTKSIDLDLRPIHHHTETRVKAHVLICMLASYVTWHLRRSWAPLTYTDEHRPTPADPVAPAARSEAAQKKASTQITTEGQPAYSYQSLLAHLATLTRNRVHTPGTDNGAQTDAAEIDTAAVFDMLATPTPVQQRAFELIGASVPTHLV